MVWRVWHDTFDTDGEATDLSKFQTFTPDNNVILQVVRTWVVAVNDPTFTSISMDLYSNEVINGRNTPKKLIASSTNSQVKATFLPNEIHAVTETYWNFDDVPLRAGDNYNIVLKPSGFTAEISSGKYLGWMHDFPDTLYPNDYTPEPQNISQAPYKFTIVTQKYRIDQS